MPKSILYEYWFPLGNNFEGILKLIWALPKCHLPCVAKNCKPGQFFSQCLILILSDFILEKQVDGSISQVPSVALENIHCDGDHSRFFDPKIFLRSLPLFD